MWVESFEWVGCVENLEVGSQKVHNKHSNYVY